MRVITGSARGRRLKTLDSLDIRPTTDEVKEAIFSIIQFDLPSASVLDLFAGSGQLGIEAMSRGANYCVFTDSSADAVSVIKENLNVCKLVKNTRVLKIDSFEYLNNTKMGFDIVFIDPPYKQGLVEKSLEKVASKLNDGAIVVCEHERELELKDSYDSLELRKCYRHGKTTLTVYHKSGS
ncbi:MAG: 16S rRNA (guanine(966)-N(2))-methyltransferase RsmD [Ruminococcus sp.]|nr:16S rRNA (guanine(966)-N(2))-methyltransferase RsmD [Ruminococcus sp.]